jgi:protein O-GlcNAc transferase
MMDKFLRRIPFAGHALSRMYLRIRGIPAFTSSGEYWEERYRNGGNSGAGSYEKFAAYKGEIINGFIMENQVRSMIEFGCGDGNQLGYFKVEKYLGFDVSETAIGMCREKYRSDPGKEFHLMDSYSGESAELTLSLDVVYHLVEDEVYDTYMKTLFSASEKYVIIYSSDYEEEDSLTADHLRLRKFTDWVQEHAANFTLQEHLPNPYPFDGNNLNSTISDFYIFRKKGST